MPESVFHHQAQRDRSIAAQRQQTLHDCTIKAKPLVCPEPEFDISDCSGGLDKDVVTACVDIDPTIALQVQQVVNEI